MMQMPAIIDREQVGALDAAARKILEMHPSHAQELFARLNDQGFGNIHGWNNLPAVMLAVRSPMMALIIDLLAEEPANKFLITDAPTAKEGEPLEREKVHAIIGRILSNPDVLSPNAQRQHALENRLKADLKLRTSVIEIEPIAAKEIATVSSRIQLPPIVGNEQLLQELRSGSPERIQLPEHVIIIAIRCIVCEGRMTFSEIMAVSR